MLARPATDTTPTQLVGIADFAAAVKENVSFHSNPLGAGLGVAVHDPVAKVSGLWHCLLPSSSIDPARAAAQPMLFVDTGLARLLSRVYELGATRESLLVYVAGGGGIMDNSACFNIGQRNYAALEEELSRAGLSVHAGDVGGYSNRTIRIQAATGRVSVKLSGQAEEKPLCKP